MEGSHFSSRKWGYHLTVNSGGEKNLHWLDMLTGIEATMWDFNSLGRHNNGVHLHRTSPSFLLTMACLRRKIFYTQQTVYHSNELL